MRQDYRSFSASPAPQQTGQGLARGLADVGRAFSEIASTRAAVKERKANDLEKSRKNALLVESGSKFSSLSNFVLGLSGIARQNSLDLGSKDDVENSKNAYETTIRSHLDVTLEDMPDQLRAFYEPQARAYVEDAIEKQRNFFDLREIDISNNRQLESIASSVSEILRSFDRSVIPLDSEGQTDTINEVIANITALVPPGSIEAAYDLANDRIADLLTQVASNPSINEDVAEYILDILADYGMNRESNVKSIRSSRETESKRRSAQLRSFSLEIFQDNKSQLSNSYGAGGDPDVYRTMLLHGVSPGGVSLISKDIDQAARDYVSWYEDAKTSEEHRERIALHHPDLFNLRRAASDSSKELFAFEQNYSSNPTEATLALLTDAREDLRDKNSMLFLAAREKMRENGNQLTDAYLFGTQDAIENIADTLNNGTPEEVVHRVTSLLRTYDSMGVSSNAVSHILANSTDDPYVASFIQLVHGNPDSNMIVEFVRSYRLHGKGPTAIKDSLVMQFGGGEKGLKEYNDLFSILANDRSLGFLAQDSPQLANAFANLILGVAASNDGNKRTQTANALRSVNSVLGQMAEINGTVVRIGPFDPDRSSIFATDRLGVGRNTKQATKALVDGVDIFMEGGRHFNVAGVPFSDHTQYISASAWTQREGSFPLDDLYVDPQQMESYTSGGRISENEAKQRILHSDKAYSVDVRDGKVYFFWKNQPQQASSGLGPVFSNLPVPMRSVAYDEDGNKIPGSQIVMSESDLRALGLARVNRRREIRGKIVDGLSSVMDAAFTDEIDLRRSPRSIPEQYSNRGGGSSFMQSQIEPSDTIE